MHAYHVISGLPRSGSTLLSAILRQNPRFHAEATSPVMMTVNALIERMSPKTEFSSFFDDGRKGEMLKGLFSSYYYRVPAGHVIFDTNRGWTSRATILKALFPAARIICCVRDVAWILDSIETMLSRNPFEISRIFGFKLNGTIYARSEHVMNSESGLIGFAWSSLREAWFGPHGPELIIVQYDSLASRPREVISEIYTLLGEQPFDHDFDNLEYDTPDYDTGLGMPGMHAVRGPVRPQTRTSRLPPDLFKKYSNMQFWNDPSLRRPGAVVI